MKLVQLLLALYVMVLSALPCEELCRSEVAPFTSSTSVPTSDDCTDEEWCSPFCVCATCPGFAVPTPFELTTAIALTDSPSANQQPTYVSPHWLNVLGQIWQPPQLG